MPKSNIDGIVSEEDLFVDPNRFPSNITDYYTRLGVNAQTDNKAIELAYKKRLKVWHPDRFVDPTQKQIALNEAKALGEAYHTLTEPRLRVRYNERIGKSSIDDIFRGYSSYDYQERVNEEYIRWEQQFREDIRQAREESEQAWKANLISNYEGNLKNFQKAIKKARSDITYSAIYLGISASYNFGTTTSGGTFLSLTMLMFAVSNFIDAKSRYKQSNRYEGLCFNDLEELVTYKDVPKLDLPKRSKVLDFLFRDMSQIYSTLRQKVGFKTD